MKNWKTFLSFAIAAIMLCANFESKAAPDKPVYLTTSTVCVEAKEAYKVDDAEYTVALYAKPNIGSRLGVGSEGVQLLGAFALLKALFKPDVVLTCLGIGLMFINVEAGATLAIVPALKISTEGLEEGSDEHKFMTNLKKRISIEDVDTVSKKDMTEAIKVVSEEIKNYKSLNVEKLTELLDENKGAMAILVKQGLKLNELEQKGVGTAKNWKELIKNEFVNEQKLADLKEAVRRKAGSVDIFNGDKFEEGTGVVNKVVGTVLTTAVTTDSGGNALLDLMSVEDLRGVNLQEPFIENFSSVSRTSKPVYPYADFEPKDGDAGFTAENAPKSQVDLKVVVKTVGPKKVTAYSTLSTEVVEDVPRMQTEATGLLLKKALLKRQSKILFGTGAGSDPIGVAGIAKTYNQAGLLDNNGNALAGSLILTANGNGVVDANLYDVIHACALQIFQTANYTDENEYFPNLVIMNPSDLASLKLKKSAFNTYLFPELVFNNGANPVKIGNINVIAKRQIAPGKIMIGDFSCLNIINYIDYTLRIGWINDNLINNLFTMVGESRFFTVIRALDQNAFIYDDIANVLNAIKAP